jgi:hypothetical protein
MSKRERVVYRARLFGALAHGLRSRPSNIGPAGVDYRKIDREDLPVEEPPLEREDRAAERGQVATVLRAEVPDDVPQEHMEDRPAVVDPLDDAEGALGEGQEGGRADRLRGIACAISIAPGETSKAP